MQNILYKSVFGVAALTAFVSCKPDLKAPDAEKGSLDVSKYVAIGNSITSGYADNALYYDGQLVSYPNLLAEQLKSIGGGSFVQPLFPMSSVGAGSTANPKLVLGYKTDCKGVSALAPVPAAAYGDAAALFTGISAQGPFNNMGVPGAKAIYIAVAGYGNANLPIGLYNPYFARMISVSEYSTASILSKAAEQHATFFSMFIGNNDVLSYALAGAASDAITSSANFNASIDGIVSTMIASGAKGGVIGNIPDVTNIPYFTTIPYNGVTLDASLAGQLNYYYNLAYPTAGIVFTEGVNPFIIQDASAPGGVRKMKSNELVLLSVPQDSLKCAFWGSKKPLANQYVLTETEISGIQTAASGYNSKLKAVADANGFAFTDVNAFMAQTKKGVTYNGISTTATFVSGGAFSLDGVHLTPRGNALLANEFIKATNNKYSSSIPQIDATKYKGVVFPN